MSGVAWLQSVRPLVTFTEPTPSEPLAKGGDGELSGDNESYRASRGRMERPVIRVAIATDQSIVRSAVRGYLACVPGIECVGEARHPEEAARLVRTCKVDVLVLDLLMPAAQDLDALRMVREVSPDVPVIVLSACPADLYAAKALLAGATAYLEKANACAGQIVGEIRAAAGACLTDSSAQPEDPTASADRPSSGMRVPNRPLATSSRRAVGGGFGDMHRQSVARTVFGLLLVVVSISMVLPANTLHLLRSDSRWLDGAATLLLRLTLGVNLDHVVAFAALGVSARFAYPRAKARYCALLLVAVAAFTELVQVWSPGRDAEIYHVLLDGLAGIAGFALAWAARIALVPKYMREGRSRGP